MMAAIADFIIGSGVAYTLYKDHPDDLILNHHLAGYTCAMAPVRNQVKNKPIDLNKGLTYSGAVSNSALPEI